MAAAKRGKYKSKFRHIYAEPARPEEQILEIPTPLTSGEGTYIKSGARYFAFSGSSVGKLYIKSLTDYGRMTKDASYIGLDCLKGKIWDFDFHPFFDNIIAMGDDSGKIAMAKIPSNGLSTVGCDNVTDAIADLGSVHSKKVSLLSFHPCANAILSSASFDKTVNIYNVELQTKLLSYQNKDTIYSLEWNENGSRIGISSKDKKIRLFDPRGKLDDKSSDAMQIIDKAFDGTKSSKIFWMPKFQWLGACGFNKQAKRELKLWDLRDLSKPIYCDKVDQASSILMPYWDDDNGILYLPGKGEGTVQYGEIVNDKQKYHGIGAYRDPQPQKGGGWVPKRALNIWKCEVQRFLKLTENAVKPVSFIVPRKSGADVFQSDIYPDCISNKASMNADEWLNGGNKEANRMNLDPDKRKDDPNDPIFGTNNGNNDENDEKGNNGASSAGGGAGFAAKKTYAQLQDENIALKKKAAALEAKLGIKSTVSSNNDDSSVMTTAASGGKDDDNEAPNDGDNDDNNNNDNNDNDENDENDERDDNNGNEDDE